MAVRNLSLENLKHLDNGKVTEAWQQALARAANDIDDRPGVKTARRISLHADMEPVLDQDGQLSDVVIRFQVDEKTPNRKTKFYPMAWRRGGNLVWNDLSEDNPHQRTIDEITGEDEEDG